MLEFLLKQSVNDFVFYENEESIRSLEKYAANINNDELESFLFEKLDYYLSQNLLFFEGLLFESKFKRKLEDRDDRGIAKKVVYMKDYKNTKANVPKVKAKKQDKNVKKHDKKKKKKQKKSPETPDQKAKRIAKSDIKKLSKSNIIKRKLGILNFKKAIKDSIVKKFKSSKTGKKIKSIVGAKLKEVSDARRKAKQQYKKSAQAYEKYVNSDDMKAKRKKLSQAVSDKKAINKRRFRRKGFMIAARKFK